MHVQIWVTAAGYPGSHVFLSLTQKESTHCPLLWTTLLFSVTRSDFITALTLWGRKTWLSSWVQPKKSCWLFCWLWHIDSSNFIFNKPTSGSHCSRHPSSLSIFSTPPALTASGRRMIFFLILYIFVSLFFSLSSLLPVLLEDPMTLPLH